MGWCRTHPSVIWKGIGVIMLVHKFFALSRNEIPKDIQYDLIKKYKVVKLSDEIVLNNELFLSGFNCYWEEIGDKQKGLNYHGISIIPNEEIPFFLIIIKEIKRQSKELEKLYNLCVGAQDKGLDIIHFGI